MSAGNESVYVLNGFAALPVYHDYGQIRGETDVTKCGRLLYNGSTHWNALLPRFHADKFAKPCSQCFPLVAGCPPPEEEK